MESSPQRIGYTDAFSAFSFSSTNEISDIHSALKRREKEDELSEKNPLLRIKLA
jgi:hypothetical protein